MRFLRRLTWPAENDGVCAACHTPYRRGQRVTLMPAPEGRVVADCCHPPRGTAR